MPSTEKSRLPVPCSPATCQLSMTSASALGMAKTTIRPNPAEAASVVRAPAPAPGHRSGRAVRLERADQPVGVHDAACEKPQRPWTRYPPATGVPAAARGKLPGDHGEQAAPHRGAPASVPSPKIRRAPASGSQPPASPLQPAPIMAAHAVDVSI